MSFQFSVWQTFECQTCYMWLHWEDRVRKYNTFFFLLLKVVLDICALRPNGKISSLLRLFYHSLHCDRICGLINGLLSDIVSEIHLT